MAGYVEDRWTTSGDGQKARTARHGTGMRWRARYRDPSGAERSKSFGRKMDADAFLVKVAGDMQRAAYIDPDAGRITLGGYAGGWLASQTCEASTRERLEQRLRLHILPVLGRRTLAELAAQPSLIQRWLGGLGVGPGTAQGVFATLSAIFTAAAEDGRVARNPCSAKSVKAPQVTRRKIRPWTTEQVAAAREALPARYRALAEAGSGLGLRQGEAFGLSPDDINWPRGDTVHIRRQVRIVGHRLCFAPPKGGRERDVPLPESVKLRLSAHLEAYPATLVTLPWKEPGARPVTARLMFTTTAEHALDRAYFHRLWRAARKAAGMANERENGFHALRHYYASLMLHAGESIRAVSEYLGHHDPAFTLRIYGHMMPDAGRRGVAAIDAALSGTSCGPETAPPPAQPAQRASPRRSDGLRARQGG